MNNIKISTEELKEKVRILSSLITDMNEILEKIDLKIKNLSSVNHTYYSSSSIRLYEHYQEQSVQIKQLQDSYKQFFQSTYEVIKKYEELESEIIKRVDMIPSIKII